MDFKSIKNKIASVGKKAKNGIINGANKAVEFSAKKLETFAIKDKKTLEKAIAKAKNTEFTDKKTGEKKTYKKRVIVIFGDEKSDFFKDYLTKFPVLVIKTFRANIDLKLAVSKIEGVDLKKYKITKIPSLVVFENQKILKVINDDEKSIQKLVNSVNLDINKEIDNL